MSLGEAESVTGTPAPGHAIARRVTVTFSPLRESDVASALALGEAEGWNQTATDWRRLLQLAPAGCFAAHDGPELIGTVSLVAYERALAWIGMLVVHPEHRGQGVGAALMRLALGHAAELGAATVKLDATPAGRPLYESLGFVAETEVERWRGTVQQGERPGEGAADLPLHAPRVGHATSLAELSGLDGRAYGGADRATLLHLLVAECPGGAVVARSGRETPAGYALARPGRAATYIGPIVANSASAATALLDEMLARFAGERVCLDLHRGGLLAPDLLPRRGLARQRPLTRMRLGPRGDAATPHWICASAGPELG